MTDWNQTKMQTIYQYRHTNDGTRHNRRRANRQISLINHIFLQWLVHKNLYNLWIEEMLNEFPAYSFNITSRSERMNEYCNQNRLLRASFGHDRSLQGNAFWQPYDTEWHAVHRNIKSIIKQLEGA